MFRSASRRHCFRAVAILAGVVSVTTSAIADTPAGLSLLYQSDAAYDPATAQRLAAANPRDLLFRVMGPQTPDSMRVSDIVSFVDGLGSWSGKLWFSADATKSAFDSGYWGNTYGSGDAYKAYVDYLVTVNAALAASNHRPFDGIFLECEGSYLAKDSSTLGRSGRLGAYLATKNSSATLIGTTGSWKQATTAPGLGLDIDLLPIQAYNFDNGDPPGFTTPSNASATSLALAISGTLAGNYVADLTALTTPGVVVMFSYEPQFFGATGSGGALWDAPLFESFLTSFRGDLSTLGVSGTATLGVYDVGAATGAWDAASLAVPEPSGWALAALGLACAAVWRGRGHRRWSLLPALFACLMPACASADDAKVFAYFIDTLNDANITATPANVAVIGEIGPGTNPGQRGHLTCPP